MVKVLRVFFAALIVVAVCASKTYAQSSGDEKPRKQFVTFFIERTVVHPTGFIKHPLEELIGKKIDDSREYLGDGKWRGAHSTDGTVDITNLTLSSSTEKRGVMVYPFGAAKGTTLALSADYETLSTIGFTIHSPAGDENYLLTGGKAYDVGLGVISSDRRPGWFGLGAHSSIIFGTGRIEEPRGRGKRYFVEMGGGITVGPVGVETFFGVTQNRFSFPRPHSMYMIPLGVRATLNF